ncbi:MAG: transcription termination/antitermination protein NusA [Chloroflexota bacterium]|nr:transcription termination/antitermination protein NusA [Chloroflexota bacterium]MDE3193217.1 transcription termination/antitermination protein NusA [Chloroflexota bacterium]
MNRELVTGLAQLSAEKGLPKEVVSDIIARAIKRAYGDEEHLDVKVDVQTGAFRIYLLKTVVEKVEDPRTQVELATAKKLKTDAQLGDVIPFEESAAALGRIGAQTAKQMIQQFLREAEREQVFAEYADREGDIINGVIDHFEAGAAIMDLGKAKAILPRSEQAPHERYFVGQHRKVLVLEVRRSIHGPQIIVSRAHKGLVKRLFELEVPEIYHGQVEVMGIAREAGSRTKIAVRSRQPGLDPVGACVGQRGLRVQAISNELGGERIEVFQYDDEPQKFVGNALSPAPVVRVDCVAEEKTAYVVVPDRYLSLAIGKEGQNARLAAKITGWRIDIRSESEVAAEMEQPPEPEAVETVAEAAPVEVDEEGIRQDLVVEAEAESALADESELEDEDRALLGGKKRRDRR